MSLPASIGVTPVEELYADAYARAFDDYVRHVKGQGYPLSERLMESAHDRACDRAKEAAASRGYRAVNFTPFAKAGLSKSRAKYGY